MTSRISHTSFDAINAYAQSVFWSQVLDFAEDPDDPNLPGHEECLITSRDRSQLLLFITVPDSKRWSGSSRWERRTSLIIAGPMAVAGSRLPIRRATSSASCPRIRPAPALPPDDRGAVQETSYRLPHRQPTPFPSRHSVRFVRLARSHAVRPTALRKAWRSLDRGVVSTRARSWRR